jgi:hypothetical protein
VTITNALSAGIGFALEYVRAAGERIREQVEPIVTGVVRLVADPLGFRRAAPAPPGPAAAGDPQAQVEEAKYYLGSAPAAPRVDREPGDLPRAYGQDRLVLLARDPWWLFAYWEITPTTRVETLRQLGADGEGAGEVLRVSDGAAWFDVELSPGAESWYVNVGRPATCFSAEIGLRTPRGRFVPLARSNTAATPPAQPAADTTVRWVTLRRHGTPVDAGAGWSGGRVVTEPSPDLAADAARSSDVHVPQ